ncbi:hypothetical protein XH99_02850 [Bradyrhizobium nanningense]|uniref:Uncharacterized protein n=1 Tax=Bradyrhizobium nanningense TaxID=1325118 RepID=A0A4Q0SCP8_9BRAD|nr:hypothetical protein [Bradyrhizobium nanningense]RXH25796.1 hypothetical protein XH84_30995 [Bradyrhizobium nanningense]RXH37112.1 hypothetical protein XH99_02850 [Bradyrhizobium nanningense]
MPRLKWLQQEECENRRSIADAVNVLHAQAVFDRVRTAEIRAGRLRLPSKQIVGLVGVFVENAAAQTTSLVTLPSATNFRARRHGSQELEEFDVFRLDGATVDGSCAVELVDGTRLRAVEVIPASLPYKVTELDWRILHHTIAMMNAEQECYTYPIPFAQPTGALDCSKLPALRGKVPPRKEILRYIAKQEPALKRPSRQKIDDTLHKFGML